MINNLDGLMIVLFFVSSVVTIIALLVRSVAKSECVRLKKEILLEVEKQLRATNDDLTEKMSSIKRHCINTVNDNALSIDTLVSIAVKEHFNESDK